MAAVGRRGRSWRCAAGAALVATLVPVAPASAEIRELTLDGGVLEIRGSDAADDVQVVAKRRSVVVSDPGGVPEIAAPCKGGAPTSVVRCPRKRVDKVVVGLLDGDDSFDGDGDVRYRVDGGKDDDSIDGGDARDRIEGKLGDDVIDGSEGSDTLLGGIGDDRLTGKNGKDLLDGGPGRDRGDGGKGMDRCIGVEKAKRCERDRTLGSLPSADR